ncbi:hypothetical protein MVEG_00877 [Podila verticillata NRRL 6337]|nr:hypothetical protein MVEG_00877 [Podila verticillata NRRL 6337]
MIDQPINTIDTGPAQDMSDGGINASPNLLKHKNQQQIRPESSHKKLNFAAALTKNLPARRTRDQIRADYKQLEDNAVKEDWNNVGSTSNIIFTHIPDEFVVGIPYDKTTIPVTDVANAIHSTFSYPSAIGINFRTRGVVFVIFATDQDRMDALAMQTLAVEPQPLPILPTILSRGRRVNIHVDYIPLYNITERRERLQELLQPYGRIIHITSHHHPTSKINYDGTSLILEVHKEAPNDVQLPRVAQIKGQNILLAWSGSPFCYRCGSGDHIKVQCPLPISYDITMDQPLVTPIMARAFPDPKAPLREIPKTTRSAPSLAKTRAQSNQQEDGFRLQGSDSALQPVTKKGSRPASQESLHKAGAVAHPEDHGEATTPPPNPAAGAADGSGGSAGLTTPAPMGPPGQEVPGGLQESPIAPEPMEEPAPHDTGTDMEGLEYTELEQMELDDPETPEERRVAIMAASRKRVTMERNKIRRAMATAASKTALGSKDTLSALKGSRNSSQKT